MNNLLPDLLGVLMVPYTRKYTLQRFEGMPFKSLFGLSHLLGEYGVQSQGLRVTDTSQMAALPVPFLAQTKKGAFIIVTSIDDKYTHYMSASVPESMSTPDLEKALTGVVLLTRATEESREPDYAQHRLKEVMTKLRNWGTVGILVALFLYLYFSNGLYHYLSLNLAMLLCAGGLTLSYLLVGKSLGKQSKAANAVCGVLQDGGCDTVLKNKASKFFGIFGWAEVGFGYFGVSLLALLVFPASWPYLALLNACCLPFTLWSIWYQKFRAKAWCTMCVGVQCTLWLLFFCYLFGGWFHGLAQFSIWPLLVLAASYVLAVFLLNMFTQMIKNLSDNGKSV